ncbi:polyisoprenoid-binding protein YceI [Litoreibacter ponti]|uniref:Polyisoprenoid-binding protein YceI n=1 Tax=Litoreibacter ponti TaxID=1510457 RepID=A0A2T6BL68_9RHOB|nr:YceI family protein [Litoreibacter ponti]PTX56792.1 polyisoprenoid-binding protein YceI [Litoreibacter ponti]
MPQLTRRALIAGLAVLPVAAHPLAAGAAPMRYALLAAQSEVGFVYTLAGVATKGSMPVKSAKVIIDPEALQRSSIDVVVDVTRARAGMIFATEALKAASVLDARRHPTIRFRSTAVRLGGQGRLSDGAKIDGALTIRGVTKPVTLNAALFRRAGSDPGDLSRLSFRVKGQVRRSDFGANGYADLVRDEIDLDIIARVALA